jgi:hypothetical protein
VRVAAEEEALGLGRDWRQIWRALAGERGAWHEGGGAAEAPPHWKLDKFEDPSRRCARMRLARMPLPCSPCLPTPCCCVKDRWEVWLL